MLSLLDVSLQHQNVTGILTGTNAITACLHQYIALALWDYASTGNANGNQDRVNAIVTCYSILHL